MEVIKDKDLDIFIFKPRVFKDERGFFLETCRESFLSENNIPPLIQDNHSRSKKGVLRGLHYQLDPMQGKLVRCSNGRIFDVAVDIRTSSSTFGRTFSRYLDDISHEQLWIPPGFAHGFYVISEYADVCYQSSNYYNPQSEQGILWDDSELDISWPISENNNKVIISEKDSKNIPLRSIDKDKLPF